MVIDVKANRSFMAEIDEVFSAFLPYIQSNPDFDILYSEKAGYYLISIANPAANTRIQTTAQMLYLLFEALIRETLFSSDAGWYIPQPLTNEEQQKCLHRTLPYLNQISSSERRERYQTQLREHLRSFPYYYCVNGRIHVIRPVQE